MVDEVRLTSKKNTLVSWRQLSRKVTWKDFSLSVKVKFLQIKPQKNNLTL